MTKIICVACADAKEFKSEPEYKQHLFDVHHATSTKLALDNERMKKANLPKDLPPGIPPDALPTKEFVDAVNRIENPQSKTMLIPPPDLVETKVLPEVKPIVLKYHYEGTHTCGNPVSTLELDTDNKHFAIAYCLFCNTQAISREVVNLNNGTSNDKATVRRK